LTVLCLVHISDNAGCNVGGISDSLYTTVGCHPTRCSDFEKSGDPDGYMSQLIDLAKKNKDKIVAIGEFGLGIFIFYHLISELTFWLFLLFILSKH